MKKFDLQERLIDFASLIIDVVRKLPSDLVGMHLGKQLVRSGTSPALHYGEAQAAESRKDFIHKMKICLKELRETQSCLKILERTGLIKGHPIHREAAELVAIFTKSVETAEKQKNRETEKVKGDRTG